MMTNSSTFNKKPKGSPPGFIGCCDAACAFSGLNKMSVPKAVKAAYLLILVRTSLREIRYLCFLSCFFYWINNFFVFTTFTLKNYFLIQTL
jgi:hypothetical protein